MLNTSVILACCIITLGKSSLLTALEAGNDLLSTTCELKVLLHLLLKFRKAFSARSQVETNRKHFMATLMDLCENRNTTTLLKPLNHRPSSLKLLTTVTPPTVTTAFRTLYNKGTTYYRTLYNNVACIAASQVL